MSINGSLFVMVIDWNFQKKMWAAKDPYSHKEIIRQDVDFVVDVVTGHTDSPQWELLSLQASKWAKENGPDTGGREISRVIQYTATFHRSKWRYMTLAFNFDDVLKRKDGRNTIDDVLSMWGEQGWEIVSVMPILAGHPYDASFSVRPPAVETTGVMYTLKNRDI